MLDAANACREVAMLTALAVAQADGDLADALGVLAELPDCPPEHDNELDARSIAEQAIRDAMVLRSDGTER